METLRSPFDSGSGSSTPDLDDQSRLLPGLDGETITSVLGDDGTVVSMEEDQRNRQRIAHPANSCGNSHCTDLACDTRVFQLPINGNNKSVFESWVITYHVPSRKLAGWYQWLGVCWWRRIETEQAHIVSVVPNSHFSQEEMAGECGNDKAQYLATGKPESGYAAALERRLRKLDWAVQDEIYDLINDRIQSTSNAFRRRDWKLVLLTQAPGGDMTDAPTGGKPQKSLGSSWRKLPFSMKRRPKMPIIEYRLVLRGTETKVNNDGWAYHNRYSRPWRNVDEKEIFEVKLRRRDSKFVSDKGINF